MAPFVHLHLHSEYSLVDSTIRIPELIDAAKRAGMPALALTDEANLFALVKFYKAAEQAGIKPIIGVDADIAQPDGESHRVLLLCQDRQGYRNLCILLSQAYRDWADSENPRIAFAELARLQQGLIPVLGQHSEIGALAHQGNLPEARQRLRNWRDSFGDRVYLEICRTKRVGESEWIAAAAELAHDTDCAVVASNDVRFLERDDFEAHEARVCIRQGWSLSDPKRPKHYSDEQYLKSSSEMAALFHDLPAAVENAFELAKRCNLDLEFGKYYLPAFPIPESAHNENDYLRQMAEQGLLSRIDRHGLSSLHAKAEYDARLALELDVIVEMGFSGYFLIVADFIDWAKKENVPVGPGRGSGAGSLVAYALGITDLDPIHFELLFERFLNPERISMPDFDIDFCMDRRDEVIDYVGRRYGKHKVSQIITYGTMAAKAVVRDTGRVLGMSYAHVDKIAKMVPRRPLDITLEDALGLSAAARREPERVSSALKETYEQEDDARQLIDLALKLEGLVRNAGKHAGGVVIAPSDLTDFTALYAEARSENMVTQFDKDDVETIGLVKFDFLGLRTLTIIDWAVRAINLKNGQTALDIARIPLHDPETFALLKSGETTAIFQLESRGMRDLIRKLQPDSFDDIVALVALFRPGPLQSGMVDDFINRKHGKASVTYPHAWLEAILKPTYGVIVYQEQVMQIAQTLAGYSLGAADLLRRAMGKKKPEEMAAQRAIFQDGAAQKGIHAGVASGIFDLMEKFAEYGFNKSHSAAYALIAYQTAWLKAHYPAEFMAAVLSSDMDNTDKVVQFLEDARKQGLDVPPPAVNDGSYMFAALEGKRISYGLGAIKGVGRQAIENIAQEREARGPYKDLSDFCERVDPGKVNKRAMEALILSGALDELAANRAMLWENLPGCMKAADQQAKNRQAGQNDLFGAHRAGTLKTEASPIEDWPASRKLTGEYETLGHYLSGHPTDHYRDAIAQMATAEIAKLEGIYRPAASYQERRKNEQIVAIGGLVTQFKKRGDQFAFVQLEDRTGRIEASFFQETFVQYAPLLGKGNILIVEGALSLDEFSGMLQIRGKRAYGIEQACESFAQSLQIDVIGREEGLVDVLRGALHPFLGGSTPIRLRYRNGGAETLLEMGEKWRVKARPELLENLKAIRCVGKAKFLLNKAATSAPTNS